MNGRRVPPLVIQRDHVLGEHHGTVHVEAGNFTLAGELHGTLDIQRGVRATIAGEQHGTVSVDSGASVLVTGSIHGTVSVASGATLQVEPGGKLAGTLANDGLVVVRGVFGGVQSGGGELRFEDGGRIRQPRIENGLHFYDW